MSGLFDQPERDDDRILAAIRWPKDVETYNHVMSIVTHLGSGVLVIDAPEAIFEEVAQAIRDADGIKPENRRRYLFQISSRPRNLATRSYVERLRELLGARGSPMKIPTTSARERYRLDTVQAYADATARLAAGGDFDREMARFDLETQLLRERYNVFLWDGPTTARGYRHPSWPTPYELIHAMSIEQRPYVEELYELIGCDGIMELCRLILQNDMTPPEARPWLEPPDRNWPEVERLLFEIYDRRYPDEEPLPRHLAQWVERYREAHPRRLTSLFE